MSPLTKVFVVLLVIVSLLQTAGTVVFINKIAPMDAQLALANSNLAAARNQATAEHNAAIQAQNDGKLIEANATANDKASKAVITGLQADKQALTVQVGQITVEKTNLANAGEKQTSDLNWMVAAYTKATEEIKNLRDTNDTLIKRQEDDSRQIAALTNQADTLKARYDNNSEQLQLAQDNIQKYRSYILTQRLNPDDAIGSSFIPQGPGVPSISGHVKETRVINGSTYVTIDVGSADNVSKGMRFSVLDTHGNFLCFANIETVDNNDSIGKLDGQADKISQVQATDNVKTQIRGS